jgi:hypothetical protein
MIITISMAGIRQKKQHSSEVQEWCFRLMNDPNQF